MKRVLSIIILLLAIAPIHVFAQFNENPVSWSAKVDSNIIQIEAKIDEGWHIYDMGPYDGGPNATSISFDLPEGVVLPEDIVQKSEPIKYYDSLFKMQIAYFENRAVFTQKFENLSSVDQKIKISIECQPCTESSCMPPSETVLQVSVTPSKEMGESNSSKGKIWAIIIEALLWGFAALLTPCVFPMVPMTVSFFIKSDKSRFHALFYGLSIVLLYTLPIAIIILITYIVGGDVITADIFNWLSTHWLPNCIFFVVFMIFAASFLGAFEITLPSSIVNKSDANADRKGLVGVFFMALTLVLVSFSCTGPIVGTVLVKSTQGEIWEPIVAMLVFSIAFALPFTFFAFSPATLKKLPKSGSWLNTIKVTLGFIELALGLKFLSVADQTYHWGILDREVYLSLWIVIFSLLGLYFLGKIRFANDDEKVERLSIKRLVAAIITFAFVMYMIPGMWGAPLKVLSGYMPPITSQDFVLGQYRGNHTKEISSPRKYSDFLRLPHGLQGFFDYDEALAYAKSVDKPLFVDFTGHGCVNCREMEANVWSDETVQSILRDEYVIVALYVDDKKELPESDWVIDEDGNVLKTIGKINAQRQIKEFGTNAQPYYCLINPKTENLIVEPRAYNLDVDGFIKFLQSAIEKYK